MEGYKPGKEDFDHFSPKSNLVSLKEDGVVIRLWNAATGKEVPINTPNPTETPPPELKNNMEQLRVRVGGIQHLEQLTYSCDGSILAVRCKANQVCVWDAVAGKERGRYEAEAQHPFALSPDGKRLVTFNRGLVLHDLVTGKEIQLKPTWGVTCCAFTPDSKTLVVGSVCDPILCWDALTGQELFPAADWREMVCKVAASSDGQLLATIDQGGRVRLWDAATGRLIRKLANPFKTTLEQKINASTLTFTRDGRKLVSSITNKGTELLIWDITGNRPMQQFSLLPGLIDSQCSLSPDDKFLALFNNKVEKDCRIVDLNNSHETPLETFYAIVAFSPNGRDLAVVGSPSPGEKSSLNVLDCITKKGLRVTNEQSTRCTSLVYSVDGRCLAATDNNGNVRLWEAATLGLIWKGPSPRVGERSESAAFAPDGQTLVTIRGEQGHNRIHLWDIVTGKDVYQLSSNEGACFDGVSFVGDSQRLVSWSDEEGTALIWDLTGHVSVQRKDEPLPSSQQLQTLWDDLCGSDAARAHRAIYQFIRVPELAVQWIREYLRPAPRIDADRIQHLLKNLDSDVFVDRHGAVAELNGMRESAASELRRALKGSLSVEARHQVEKLLQAVDMRGLAVGQLRAVAVLEHIDSYESRLLLKAVSEREPETPLTLEAKAALERLSRKRH